MDQERLKWALTQLTNKREGGPADREIEILYWYCRGWSQARIAKKVNSSGGAISFTRSNIFSTLARFYGAEVDDSRKSEVCRLVLGAIGQPEVGEPDFSQWPPADWPTGEPLMPTAPSGTIEPYQRGLEPTPEPGGTGGEEPVRSIEAAGSTSVSPRRTRSRSIIGVIFVILVIAGIAVVSSGILGINDADTADTGTTSAAQSAESSGGTPTESASDSSTGAEATLDPGAADTTPVPETATFTATPTATPTATSTRTPSPTPSATNTSTPSPTPTSTNTNTPTPEPTPSFSVPFEDTFDNSHSDAWEIISPDGAFIDDGRLTSVGRELIIELGDGLLTDYVLDLDFGGGLVTEYVFQLSPDLRFVGGTNGQPQSNWQRYVDNQWENLAREAQIGTGGRLKFTVIGNSYRIELNGELMTEITYGMAQTRTIRLTLKGTSWIDNVRVTLP